MQNKVIFLIIAIFSFLAIPVHVEANTGIQEPDKASAESRIPYRGMLYQIRHGDKTAYLFGTIHAGHSAFYPLDTRTTAALSDSSQLVIEFDPRNTQAIAAAMTRYGFYSGTKRLDNQLPGPSIEKLRKALLRFGLPFEQVTRMKPWMAAHLMIALDVERDGISMRSGTEYYLTGFAERHKKKVLELETADYQLSLFDAMTASQQQTYLLETLEEIESGEADRKTKRLLHAWSKGENSILEAAYQELIAERTETSNFTRTVLLSRRNSEMAAKIDALLKNGPSSFIAIGLLHLLGNDGLPELLRQKGYTVRRLH